MLINSLVVAEKLLVCEWLKHSNQTLAFTLTLKFFKNVNYVPTSVSLHRVAWTRIQKRRLWIWFFYFSMIIRWKSNFKIQYTSWSRTFCNLMISLNVCKDVVFVVPFSQDGYLSSTAYFDHFPYTKKPRPYAAGYLLETESFYSVYEVITIRSNNLIINFSYLSEDNYYSVPSPLPQFRLTLAIITHNERAQFNAILCPSANILIEIIFA